LAHRAGNKKTSSEMIIWGGFDGSNRLNTGGRYDPHVRPIVDEALGLTNDKVHTCISPMAAISKTSDFTKWCCAADQFFSESQFESYRMLGAYTMEKLCTAGGGFLFFISLCHCRVENKGGRIRPR
jgi:hypothetical protein